MLTVLSGLAMRFFRRPATRIGMPRPPRRRSSNRFALAAGSERLEPRCLLSATAAEIATDPAAGLEKFQSREEIRDYILDQLHMRWEHILGTHGQTIEYTDYGCGWREMWPNRGVDVSMGAPADSTVSVMAEESVIAQEPMIVPVFWFCPIAMRDEVRTDVSLTRSVALLSPADHSGTNDQIAGVEEADLVQTDGQFLYLLSGGELVIVEAGELSISSRTRLVGTPLVQFLHGDRLTVVSRKDAEPGLDSRSRTDFWSLSNWSSQPRNRIVVSVFDVSDRSQPRLANETVLDGEFVQARSIGDQDYIIVRNVADWSWAYTEWFSPRFERTETGITYEGYTAKQFDWSYETWEEYRTRLLSGPDVVDYVLPGIYRPAVAPTPGSEPERVGRLSDPEEIPRAFVEASVDPWSNATTWDATKMVTVVQIDAGAVEPRLVDVESVFTTYDHDVFVSAEHVYVTSTDSVRDGLTLRSSFTNLFQIRLRPEGVELTATGQVAGRVLNQFSMDEFAGYFRIATTHSGWTAGTFSMNTAVFVLDTVGPTLDVVGQLANLAPGETLMSARFLGDRAYVVTYRMVDPLFVIDLSDPTSPTVLGELKIPGFSQYLHPIGNDQVIGIGRNGGGFWSRGALQVSVFDVSDDHHPEALSQWLDTSGGEWGGVPLENNPFNLQLDHHAVSYFPESRILAVPVWHWQSRWSVANTDISATRFQPYSLKVLQIDDAGGLHLLGEIAHEHPVVRSLRIGDRLYSISRETQSWLNGGADTYLTIKVHSLDDPSVLLGRLSLVNNEPTVYQPPVVVPSYRRHSIVAGDGSFAFQQEPTRSPITAGMLDPSGSTGVVASALPSLLSARPNRTIAIGSLPSSAAFRRLAGSETRLQRSSDSVCDSVSGSDLDELWTGLGAQVGSLSDPVGDLFGRRDNVPSDDDSPAARLHRRPAVVSPPREAVPEETTERETKASQEETPAPNPPAADELPATPPA